MNQKTDRKIELNRRTRISDLPTTSCITQHVAQMREAVSEAEYSEMIKNVAKSLARNAQCLGLWHVVLDDQPEPGIQRRHNLLFEESDLLLQTWQEKFDEIALFAHQTNQVSERTVADTSKLCFLAAPLNNRTNQVLVAAFMKAKSVDWIFAHALEVIETWQASRRAHVSETSSQSMLAVSQIVQSLDQSKSEVEACMKLVNNMRTSLGATHVVLGLKQKSGDELEIKAISDVESFERDGDVCRSMLKLMKLAENREEPFHWPVEIEADSDGQNTEVENVAETEIATLSQQYCEDLACASAFVIALKNSDQETVGTLLIGGPSKSFVAGNRLQYLSSVSSLVGGHLMVVIKSHRKPLQLLMDDMRRGLRHERFRKFLLCSAAVLGLLMLPWPLNINCESLVQPTLRRHIAAPHDGILEVALVESGQVVEKGDVLAKLDARQIRIELATQQADYNSHRKQRDASMAAGNIAESQINSLEMKRLISEIRLLQQRLSNLDVTSPIAGIVVHGDLEKVEGAPVKMGQNLFEVSPLDQLTIEVSIPESDIQYVKQGMQVSIKLDAFPFKIWEGKVEKINPRAEIIENKNVFVAEVTLPNRNQRLKPGMKGRAIIEGQKYPLGWALVRKPWEQFRTLLVW